MGPTARFDEWGIRAAEQLETSVGPWIALASYKRLFTAPSPIKERAMLGALRCAVALGDRAEIDQAAAQWSKASAGFASEEPTQLALRALARGAHASARVVAQCEHDRRRSARSAYTAARIFGAAAEVAGPSEDAMLRDAQQLAALEKAADIGAAAAARRLEILEAESNLRPVVPYRREALAIARDVVPGDAPAPVKLLIARAQLLSPGRFARAGALSTLADLVRLGGGGGGGGGGGEGGEGGEGGDIARAAALAIARHVDAMGVRLTPIETERALHGFAGLGAARPRQIATERTKAVAALASAPATQRADAARAAARGEAATEELVVRARALASGSAMPSHGHDRFADPFVALAALGLDALGAIASDKPAAARAALVAAGVRIGPAEPIPAPLWSAVLAGLTTRGEIRDVAARLGGLLVCRAAGEPPQGFLAFGEALALAGAADAAREALDLAARGREPGAKEALARAATIAAWKAYDAGDTTRARTLLLEARAAAK